MVRSAIHIGTLPIRKDARISTGNLVSSTCPGQMVTVTASQFAMAKITSTAVSKTQMIVRRIPTIPCSSVG